MKRDYDAWLRSQGYDEGTIAAQLSRCARVEEHYGDLDQHYAADQFARILEALSYSSDDERRGLPNPTPIPIRGVLRTNLASYKSAVQFYRRFVETGGAGSLIHAANRRALTAPAPSPSESTGHTAVPRVPPEHARTLAEFGFDGQSALTALIAASRYRTVAQAVASLTLFSHPVTVAQTSGRAIFPTVRGEPGKYVEFVGRRLMEDDNKSPTDAFLWANALGRRGRDTQFNHVYAASGDPDAYTALANICMTPAFLAKLTDTHPEVRGLLAYRSYDLYGWSPAGQPAPERPEAYSALEWAAPLPAVEDVRSQLLRRMAKRPRDRTVLAAQALGWLFS